MLDIFPLNLNVHYRWLITFHVFFVFACACAIYTVAFGSSRGKATPTSWRRRAWAPSKVSHWYGRIHRACSTRSRGASYPFRHFVSIALSSSTWSRITGEFSYHIKHNKDTIIPCNLNPSSFKLIIIMKKTLCLFKKKKKIYFRRGCRAQYGDLWRRFGHRI